VLSNVWLNVIPIVVVLSLSIGIWRPVSNPTLTAEQEQKIADLARLLGSPSSSADAVEERVKSFDAFPPESKAARALADALINCRMANLDDAQRRALARRLYAITAQNDVSPETTPDALAFIGQAASASPCDPAAVDRLMSAAREVARTDPHPRRDWW